MCKAATLGKIKRKWKYLGGLTVVQYQKKNCHFPLLPPSLFLYVLLSPPHTDASLKSLSFPLSLVISSSQVPMWYSWNSLGTFFLCSFLSGMFFTNFCSGLFHPTQVFYSVVTFWVRSFLKTPNQNHIHPCHTHTYSHPTPGLIILS